MSLYRRLRSMWTRWRFERAFAAELRRVKVQQAKHAKVEPSRAELQARVHDALARKGSA